MKVQNMHTDERRRSVTNILWLMAVCEHSESEKENVLLGWQDLKFLFEWRGCWEMISTARVMVNSIQCKGTAFEISLQ